MQILNYWTKILNKITKKLILINLIKFKKNKINKYTDAWDAFNERSDEETAQPRRDLRIMNSNRGGAPKISTFGMCLSGSHGDFYSPCERKISGSTHS